MCYLCLLLLTSNPCLTFYKLPYYLCFTFTFGIYHFTFQPPAKEAAATANKKDEKKVTEQIDTVVAKETQNGHAEKMKKKKHKKHDEEPEVISGNSKATADEADAEAERGCRKKKKNKRKRDEEEVIEEAASKKKKLKTQSQQLYLLHNYLLILYFSELLIFLEDGCSIV